MYKTRANTRRRMMQTQALEPSPCLLLDRLPEELLRKCAERLDVKSCVMVSSTCKTMHGACKDVSKLKTEVALGGMIKDTVDLMVSIQKEISREPLQNKLLADILRKLIFVSVTSAQNTDGTSRIAYSNCLSEYHRLRDYFADAMNLSWLEYNNLLEDAQFEYRGFNIIGLTQERRDVLDLFKQHLHANYFSDSFIIHSYVTLNSLSMELNYDQNEICFDIHKIRNPFEKLDREWDSSSSDDEDGDVVESRDPRSGVSIFFQELVSKWEDGAKGTLNEGTLKEEFKQSIISNISDMLWWDPLDVRGDDVPFLLGRMITQLMPEATSILQGTTDTKIEFWNDTLEDNWLLSEVINDFIRARGFQTTLSYITFAVSDVFNLM